MVPTSRWSAWPSSCAQRPVGLDDAAVEAWSLPWRPGSRGRCGGTARWRRPAPASAWSRSSSASARPEHGEERDRRRTPAGPYAASRPSTTSVNGPVARAAAQSAAADHHDARPRHAARTEPQRGPHEQQRGGERERIVPVTEGEHAHRDDRDPEGHRLERVAADAGTGRRCRRGQHGGADDDHADRDRHRARPGVAPEGVDARGVPDRARDGLDRGAECATDRGGGRQGAQLPYALQPERTRRVPAKQERGRERGGGGRHARGRRRARRGRGGAPRRCRRRARPRRPGRASGAAPAGAGRRGARRPPGRPRPRARRGGAATRSIPRRRRTAPRPGPTVRTRARRAGPPTEDPPPCSRSTST